MTANATQWKKEVRQMAWPWAIVTGAGLLVLARTLVTRGLEVSYVPGITGLLDRMFDWMLPVGTFFGTAILAVEALGSEFQYRTMAMRLSQPIDREEVWRQKFSVTLAAVVPAAVIYCIALGMRDGLSEALATAAWMLVTLAGAIPFTMLARSIVGGIVMTQFGGCWVMLFWSYYDRHRGLPAVWAWGMGMAIVAYTCLMIWLGRRMVLRFQAVDGMQAREDFVPGARFVPEAVTRWFECRPGQPIMNLIRREFRLMRVLWPLIAVYVVASICVVMFRLVPDERSGQRYIAFAFTVILAVIIAVLAGTLSLGEEKTWGTHDWHMTLPVSTATQWAVKLLFAIVTSVVGVALVPMAVLAVGRWAGYPIGNFLGSDVVAVWILEAAGITLVAFWCACVVKGTIQATLWIFPLLFGIGLSSQLGSWALGLIENSLRNWIGALVAWLNPLTVGRVAERLLSRVGLQPLGFLVIAPLLAIGLIQSMRMFRAQVGANKLRLVRFAVPLMAVTFVWGAASGVLIQVLRQTWQQSTALIWETDNGIGVLLKKSASANAGPRQISADELAKAAPLSDRTRRWLGNANVTVTPMLERKTIGFEPHVPGTAWVVLSKDEGRGRTPYTAMVHNTRSGDCSMTFRLAPAVGPTYSGGFVRAICQ